MSNYTFSFSTPKPSKEIFDFLLDIHQWWSGIYGETIIGNSLRINDEFSLSAGGGAHHTKQKLVEVIPSSKIVWEVTESNLSFLDNPKEWESTKLVFDIWEKDEETHVQFTHFGLEPQIECYSECSAAWAQYFQKLEEKLNHV